MNLKKVRTYKKYSRYCEGFFSKNPVLISGLALPFAVMVSVNLKSAVALSITMAGTVIPTVLLASLIGQKLPKWICAIIYTVFSMVMVVTCAALILPMFPEIVDALGVYIPIVAVNTMLLWLCSKYSSDKPSPWMALVDAVMYSLGFAFAICLISLLREYFGNNTIWGVAVNFPIKFSGLQIAFSGFILVAFLNAGFRGLKRLILFAVYRHSNPKVTQEPSSAA